MGTLSWVRRDYFPCGIIFSKCSRLLWSWIIYRYNNNNNIPFCFSSNSPKLRSLPLTWCETSAHPVYLPLLSVSRSVSCTTLLHTVVRRVSLNFPRPILSTPSRPSFIETLSLSFLIRCHTVTFEIPIFSLSCRN